MAYLNSCVILLFFATLCSSKNRYLIDLPKCRIPNIEILSDEVKRHIEPLDYKNCTARDLLTMIENKHLRINPNAIAMYVDGVQNLNCCYSRITRQTTGDPDSGIEISGCVPFSHTQSIPMDNDPVMVTCKNQKFQTIYENVHSSVVITEKVEAKFKRVPPNAKPISVLFVVLDSVSRLNFIRTMSSTYAFLKENEFVEMLGYNKVDENTLPNFKALLTGFNYDEHPMIWKDYRELGYATAYAEDYFDISTFNFGRKGFLEAPTDYYFRSYVGAAERLKIEHIARDSGPYCAGPETEGERILNAAKDFALTFKGKPSFGIFWMNTFSHNDLNLPFSMDEQLKAFFVDLKSNGILDESIVVLLADHGMRMGEYRATKTGWFEEKLPVNLISVPKWFRSKFPREYEALRFNSDKFTNTFDFYMTLQHVLTLSGLNYTIKSGTACPKCQSWFERVPLDRDCLTSGIAPEWCTCIGYLNDVRSDDVYVKNATKLIQRLYITDGGTKPLKILSASLSENLYYTSKRTIVLELETFSADKYLATLVFDGVVTEETTQTVHVVKLSILRLLDSSTVTRAWPVFVYLLAFMCYTVVF